jgi:GAF domain-containing protein
MPKMKAKRIVPGRNFKAALRDLKALFCLQQTLTEAIHKAKTGEEALQASLDLVCDHTGWPVGHARRVRGDSVGGVGLADVWHLEDSRRYEPLVRTTQATQKPAVTDLFARALKSGVPVWVKYLARDCDCERTHTALELGLLSGGAFPVYFGDEVVAVLEFYASSSCQPDRELLDLLRCIGLQLGPVFGHVTADQGHLLGALLDNIPDNV